MQKEIFNYHDTPSQEVFEEIKEKAIEIWNTYDNQYGYVDEKVEYINSLHNYHDNAWAIVGMFDSINRLKLLAKVSAEVADLIQSAIES